MYKYNDIDRKIVNERVEQFRDQTRRFLAGTLGEDEFRALRLMNGLYIQRFAPMLRVAVPYGLLSSTQLRKLAYIARTYDRNYGHFTTRQNIQYNWPKLEQVPDILAHLASVEMHAIQTSGNCIRNVTSDHLAGVTPDEIEDPRPYCEIIRQWSTFHPEFIYLPRKFKIAVSGAEQNDRAAIKIHDIGVYIVKNAGGETGFKILAGGGLGRTPYLAPVVREFIEKKHLLSYLEAILRVYNQYGRRDNIYKSRIKILVTAVGIEKFRQMVEQEWEYIRDEGRLTLDEKKLEYFRKFFIPHTYDESAATDASYPQQLKADKDFAVWAKYNTLNHKVPGYRCVFVCLKAPGIPPGDATSEQMDAVADLADRYSFGQIRVTHEQNLILADVKQADVHALYQALEKLNLATANIGTLNDMICCPGLDFCALANASSISIAKQINAKFNDLDYLYDLGEIKLKMSGCINACGHHHVGHIGILGVDKKGEEVYQIQLGGSAAEDASIAKIIGPAIDKSEVANTLEKILNVYTAQREDGERFIDTYRRIGIEPFKHAVYGAEVKAAANA
ncbi:MAG TPA: nitrite/sulfite reductase [Gammaproteobacteria bacterium]|nr:nitrite/sulfite reductase [Gammaproteobacteria bacterium]